VDIVNSLAILVSGGLMVGSIILSRFGIEKSILSRKNGSIISGIGSGFGASLFTYFGISHHDLVGSIFPGLFTALVVGFTIFVMSKNNFR
jgi:hypothetical protein